MREARGIGGRRARFVLGVAAVALVAFAASLKPVTDREVASRAPGDGFGAAGGVQLAADSGPDVVKAVRHDVSEPLRRLEPEEPPPGPPVRISMPESELREAEAAPAAGTDQDPVVQAAAPVAAQMPAPDGSFAGISQADNNDLGITVVPPDTNGDVGPNHYVQFVNLALAVWTKDGTLVYGPVTGNTIWSGFGGLCDSRNHGDPTVVYDHLADRWVVSRFAFQSISPSISPPGYECVAVSQTANPTGAWNRYAFLITNSTNYHDYPKLGVWSDGYYLSYNLFNASSGSFAGQGVAALERDRMLNGLSAEMVSFTVSDGTLAGLLPSDLDGPAPPAGAPAYFAQMDDDIFGYPQDQLEIWEFHVDWDTTSNSTLTLGSTVPTAAFDSILCTSANCITQPDTAQKLDGLSDRLMYRLQYRNFGTHETLVVNHTVLAEPVVDEPARAGVRWYQLVSTAGSWSVDQQGTYSPDTNHRWMGSAAMDGAGNLAVGYSASGSSLEPAVRYAGRLASDPPNTLAQGEATLIAGGGHQTLNSGRWGDYSSMSVDPGDDCTFWYTQEHYSSTSSSGWSTRIGSFSFPGCSGGGGPDTASPTGLSVTNPSAAFTKQSSFPVSWTAIDPGSGVASFDVRVREAPFDGDFGPWTLWLDDTSSTGADFGGEPGNTYCFEVSATDNSLNTSGFSADTCTSIPLDDRALVSSGAWSRFNGSGHYLGTFSQSRSKGSVLSLADVHAKELAIVVARCPSCGKIKVFWRGMLLKRINLYSPVVRKNLTVGLGVFAGMQIGKIRVRNITGGKPVRIDGLGVGNA
ncbi:MAG: hypothetical protein WD276_03670 [Actinomycetota bacterium]